MAGSLLLESPHSIGKIGIFGTLPLESNEQDKTND